MKFDRRTYDTHTNHNTISFCLLFTCMQKKNTHKTKTKCIINLILLLLLLLFCLKNKSENKQHKNKTKPLVNNTITENGFLKPFNTNKKNYKKKKNEKKQQVHATTLLYKRMLGN